MGCCAGKDAEGGGPERQRDVAKAPRRSATVVPVSHGAPAKEKVPMARRKLSTASRKRLEDKLARGEKTKVVSLEGEGVTMEVVAKLDAMEGLKVVDLGGTGVEEVPAMPRCAASLKRLDVSKCKLRDGAGASLAAFTKLNVLDLSYNTLTELPDLAPLAQLKELAASYNLFAALTAPLPTSLRVLKLSGNRLTAVPDAVFALPKLQTLVLKDNQLATFGDDAKAARLQDLKSLDVSGNHLTALPETLFSSTALTQLTIAGNPVTERELRQMASFEEWMQRRASTINRKIQGGADFELIK
eukprot:TRINITY_DN9447_c0_g1_i1.p2 TRINITY_DN9447_c0_g1~~TRINITY_DN9447_c0_g1_i1.p2  ORF type:complete len:330 (+),score=102.47 TRINITY_DN9447_c0_g1_i1:92-991(+)